MEDSAPDSETEVDATPWAEAPADSHVKSFRYLDRRAASTGGPSELYVTFRATKSKGEVTYKYSFYDHDTGQTVFGALSSSANPGEVVWSDLIRKNVPCAGPM